MNADVELSIQQLVGAWQLMCGASAGYVHKSGDGMDLIFCGLPVAFFNVAIPTQDGISGETLKSMGSDACSFAADSGLPWIFILTYDTVEEGVESTAVLDECGLAPIMAMTGMVAKEVAPLANVPNGLELVVPQDDAGCAEVLDVNSAAYGMDLEAGKEILGKRSFWKDHFLAIGKVDGKPVSSTAVMMVDGVRYVALVATDPEQQRKGYADAAMRKALKVAAQAHGDVTTLLHATDAGRPVYERMGYKPISTHMIFMEKRFLEGH
jgi:GNAT superfamily N-acetyltransferase